jgi:uncharacterized protein (DUF1330 family)
VRDANKQALAFIYCEDEPSRRANDNLSSIAQSQRSGPQLPSGSKGRKSCKQSTQLALALAAGFALGAGAIHGLHAAAAAPPAYVIGEIAVKDEAGYKNDFLPAAQKAIDDNGGKYLAGGFNKTFSITGEPPANRVVILQFENMDKVRAWRDVARDAQEKIGNKYATFRTFAVEGVTQY